MKHLVMYVQNLRFSILKVFFLIFVALIFPRLFFFHRVTKTEKNKISYTFALGIENIDAQLLFSLHNQSGKSVSVGLITNQTGIDQAGLSTAEILRSHGICIKTVFTPEQQFITDQKKKSSIQIPVKPMYKKNSSDCLLSQSAIKDLDVIMFDMQDMGMRQTRYVKTLKDILELAAASHKPLIVFDRPNLLGACVEGAAHDDVSDGLAIPVRYGMTVGELAQFINSYLLPVPASLTVVPMKNYQRGMFAHQPLSCQLSQNINSIASCHGYSFLGLLGEVAPFDIGIGTDKAFQCILLPENISFNKEHWYQLKKLLADQGIESTFYRYKSNRKKQHCSGLRLHISDINTFSSCNTFIKIIQFFKDTGLSLNFSKGFDVAVGTPLVREFLQGSISEKEFREKMNGELKKFFGRAFTAFIYKPLPRIILV